MTDEKKELNPFNETLAQLLRGQQAMIDSVTSISGLIHGQAKEIRELSDRLEHLERIHTPDGGMQ